MATLRPIHTSTSAGASDPSGSATVAGAEEGQRLTTVYVWDLAVRLTHWINVSSILVLSVTGFYIGTPIVGTHGPATAQFLMGAVRFIHFTVAFVFTTSVLFRVYWAFRGNRYARWGQFLPLRRGRRRSLWKMLGYYTFVRREPPPVVGHNPLAGVTYTGLYVLFGLQIATGFALYSQPFHDGIWKTLFGWMIVVFGAQPLRLIHYLIMFLIIAFTIHHVYSAVLIDIEEHNGLLSSIVTGRKTLSARYLADATLEDVRPAGRWPFSRARKGGRTDADG
jgi:Ni/Fe-hydrogenase 1 B-type cytochrome subunit